MRPESGENPLCPLGPCSPFRVLPGSNCVPVSVLSLSVYGSLGHQPAHQAYGLCDEVLESLVDIRSGSRDGSRRPRSRSASRGGPRCGDGTHSHDPGISLARFTLCYNGIGDLAGRFLARGAVRRRALPVPVERLDNSNLCPIPSVAANSNLPVTRVIWVSLFRHQSKSSTTWISSPRTWRRSFAEDHTLSLYFCQVSSTNPLPSGASHLDAAAGARR